MVGKKALYHICFSHGKIRIYENSWVHVNSIIGYSLCNPRYDKYRHLLDTLSYYFLSYNSLVLFLMFPYSYFRITEKNLCSALNISYPTLVRLFPFRERSPRIPAACELQSAGGNANPRGRWPSDGGVRARKKGVHPD